MCIHGVVARMDTDEGFRGRILSVAFPYQILCNIKATLYSIIMLHHRLASTSGTISTASVLSFARNAIFALLALKSPPNHHF